jgi:hypothetical protein
MLAKSGNNTATISLNVIIIVSRQHINSQAAFDAVHRRVLI